MGAGELVHRTQMRQIPVNRPNHRELAIQHRPRDLAIRQINPVHHQAHNRLRSVDNTPDNDPLSRPLRGM
ncbi:MAG: hypothetical protein QOG10_4605 [Kribbellaceae bacterium]|nr:hypothetical protein [Kribbellaceae bacterium]